MDPQTGEKITLTNWSRHTEARLSRVFERLKARRVELFVEKLGIGPYDSVLDLGSEDGSYLSRYFPYPGNIVIADINEEPMRRGVEKNGLKGYRVIPVDGPLPFADREFTAVWCNSVMEHVTIPRAELGNVSHSEFKERADAHQRSFAREIARIADSYFVQTPYVHFPIESHSILPLIPYFRHPTRFRLSRATKKIWVKQWTADFYLYDWRRFRSHFPDATEIMAEKSLGLTKSLMAIRKA